MCTIRTCILVSTIISPPKQVAELSMALLVSLHCSYILALLHYLSTVSLAIKHSGTQSLATSKVARCRNGDSVFKVCLEAGKCWLGWYNVTVYTSLFLDFFHQLAFPCSYQWHQRHHPPSLHLYLFLWETFLRPLFLYFLWSASCMTCEHEPCHTSWH